MFRRVLTLGLAAGAFALCGCKRSEEKPAAKEPAAGESPAHVHADGSTHADHESVGDQPGDAHEGGEDHGHDEVSLGSVTIGDMTVELAQGHGVVEAGKESHLVVKLPYNDKGATVVRAWIGTEDRLSSVVGKGEYAASHDDYDIHATAPAPLPDDVRWWIEIEKPDGTRIVGSAAAKLE